jgi:hypothetical protein
MASPFPGMDPFLEGYLWPDVHNELASKIRRQLMPLIQPDYFAHLNIYIVEDMHPESDVGVLYPDVEVMFKGSKSKSKEPIPAYGHAGFSTPTATIAFRTPIEVKIPVIEIKNAANQKLVTAIEILSPVNKKSSGLEQYRQKRIKLHRSGVHLLEIDLLRRGTRAVQHPELEKADYFVALTRAGQSTTDLWTISLKDVLPVVPVPLVAPDPDVPLDLQRALREVYEEAAYHISIDYAAAIPPPKLSEEDSEWVKKLLERSGKK